MSIKSDAMKWREFRKKRTAYAKELAKRPDQVRKRRAYQKKYYREVIAPRRLALNVNLGKRARAGAARMSDE
jgi:hypothetical protein